MENIRERFFRRVVKTAVLAVIFALGIVAFQDHSSVEPIAALFR